ncbi:uncharacterized protein LOC100369563 [Saccoglossus kowalevskii]
MDDMSVLLELPYRCPRCGETRRFPSLSALKSHLEFEHTYPAPDIFSPNSSFGMPRTHKSAFRPWEKFSAEAKELERQLAHAKESERRHKRDRDLYSPAHTIDDFRRSSLDDSLRPSSRRSLHERRRSEELYDSYPKNDRHAENKYLDEIERLRSELKSKDKALDTAHEELQKLTLEKRKLQNDVLILNRQIDDSVQHLANTKQRLDEKEKELKERERANEFMNSFLKATAEKEASAKEQLKSYIESLADRAEKAESEVMTFKSPLSTLNRTSNLSRASSVNRNLPDLQRTSPVSILKSNSTANRPQSAPNPETHIPYRPITAQSLPATSLPNRRHTVGITPQQFQSMRPQLQFAPNTNAVQTAPQYATTTTNRRHTVGITPQHVHGIFQQPSYPITAVHSTPDLHSISAPTNHQQMLQLLHHPTSSSRTSKHNRKNIHYADSGISSNGSSHNSWDIAGMPRRGYFLSQKSEMQPSHANQNGYTPGKVQALESVDPYAHSVSPVQNGMSPPPNLYMNGFMDPDVEDDIGLDMMEEAYNEISRKKAQLNAKQKLMKNERDRLQRLNGYQDDKDDIVTSDTITMTTDEDSDMDDAASQGELPQDLVKQKEQAFNSDRRKRYRSALFCIFSYLETKTLLKVGLVSRDWLQVSRHPALWKKVKLSNHRISSKFLQTISKWCTETVYLSLEGLRGRKMRANETTQDYLNSTRGCLESGLEYLIKASEHMLITLRIADCSNILTDRALWLCSCHCKTLQNIMYISEFDPVGHEVIWALGAGCRNVVSLQIPPMHPCQKPHKFNNRCMQMVGRCWPLLRALSIGGIDVDEKGLVSITKNCARLQLLEMDHMLEITEEIAISMCRNGLRAIERLIFTATPVTPKALLQFNSSCPQLIALTINIGISDYFADTKKPSNIETYNTIIGKLQSLKKRPGMAEILHLRTDFG